MAPNPQLFVDGVEAGDVIQGQLGDCWFLGALAVVATRIDLIKRVVVAYQPNYGFVRFKFYKNGEWHVITIDDQIPCVQHGSSWKPWASSCKDQNEMWVPLIEKAYAKLHGSYQSLEGGFTCDGFVDLTGGFSETLQFTDPLDFWSVVGRSIKENWLMGCSCSGGKEKDSGMGILTGHAYSILRATEYKGDKLLQIRNPWGQKEWCGKWSDTDTARWTADAKRTLKHSAADDGTFWMTYEDWKRQYNRMFICRLYDDDFGHKYSKYILKGTWSGSTAGGCSNFQSWKNNPQFCFQLKKPCELVVVLTQEDERMKGVNHKHYAIGFGVFLKMIRLLEWKSLMPINWSQNNLL